MKPSSLLALLATTTTASSVAAAALGGSTAADSALESTPWTDPASGIAFQALQHKSGFKFGVALPKTPGADFIGVLHAPKKIGWAGGDLGPAMIGKLLIVAWPNGKTVMASTRKATRKTNPRDFTTGGTLTPIPTGTFVNSTHWQYTFVCRGCAVGKTGFAPAAVKERLAFALGEDAPAALGNRSAPLTFHGLGAAAFSVRLEEARSERFVGWSKLV